jgi:hypothetical protein
MARISFLSSVIRPSVVGLEPFLRLNPKSREGLFVGVKPTLVKELILVYIFAILVPVSASGIPLENDFQRCADESCEMPVACLVSIFCH